MASLGCPPDLPCPGEGKTWDPGSPQTFWMPGFIRVYCFHIYRHIIYIYICIHTHTHIYMYVYMRMIYVTVYLSFGAMFWNVWTLKLVCFGAWKRQQKKQWSRTSNFLAVLNLELNTDSVQKMEPEKMIREMGVLQGALGFLGPRDLLSRSTCQVFLISMRTEGSASESFFEVL